MSIAATTAYLQDKYPDSKGVPVRRVSAELLTDFFGFERNDIIVDKTCVDFRAVAEKVERLNDE